MHARGFTLLEVVVALAIMALAMAMVAPASFRMIGAWQDSSDVGRVLKRVASLPIQARQSGQLLRLDTDTPDTRMAEILDLPAGWKMEFAQPLIVHPNGACAGASATLRTERQSIPLQIHAPYCRPERS